MEISRASVASVHPGAASHPVRSAGDQASDAAVADRFEQGPSSSRLSLQQALSGALDTAGKDLHGAAFVGAGLRYKLEEALTGQTQLLGKPLSLGILHPDQNLDAEPVPHLDRPVVLVPGWTGKTTDYAPLVNHLTKDGANGGQPIYVREGHFYTQSSDGQLAAVHSEPNGHKDLTSSKQVYADMGQFFGWHQ